MTRSFAAAVLVSVVALALGACHDDTSDSSGYGTIYGGTYAGDSCNSYTTCGTCTPVAGCGWCFSGGTGLCASSPDECSTMDEFTWDWNPGGCPDVDASVVALDAGISRSVDAGTTPEASGVPEAAAVQESGVTTDGASEASSSSDGGR